MCIRDSDFNNQLTGVIGHLDLLERSLAPGDERAEHARIARCLLYTSDAADERSSVDLGGRRIIKKKKYIETSDEKV